MKKVLIFWREMCGTKMGYCYKGVFRDGEHPPTPEDGGEWDHHFGVIGVLNASTNLTYPAKTCWKKGNGWTPQGVLPASTFSSSQQFPAGLWTPLSGNKASPARLHRAGPEKKIWRELRKNI